MCGLNRFNSRFEGISNRIYGTKLQGISSGLESKEMQAHNITRAVLYSVPVSFRSCFIPYTAALATLTLSWVSDLNGKQKPDKATYRSRKAITYKMHRTGITLRSILVMTLRSSRFGKPCELCEVASCDTSRPGSFSTVESSETDMSAS